MSDLATAVETRIAAPYERVWHALRDRDELRRWHGWDYEEIDAEIDVIYFRGAEPDAEAGTLTMGDGSRFELKRAGDATVVRLLMPARDVDWERDYDEMREGWTSFITQLKFALERHPGEERRTLQLSGSGEPPLDAPGELFQRNEHQAARVVDEYGPGLVIVHDVGMAIVTTYGLDDDAFAAVERLWRERY